MRSNNRQGGKVLINLSIKQRMFFILILIFIMFVCMSYFSVASSYRVRDLAMADTERLLIEDQKEKIKLATESLAIAIGKSLEQISEYDDKVKAIQKEVDDIRYEQDGSGYFFVYQNTKNIAFPVSKKNVGKDLGHIKDKNGVFVIKELFSQAKAGGGYVNYIWPKPGSGNTPKLSFATIIPGTEFWIGTGVYIDNIEAQKFALRNKINKRVSSMMMTMAAISGAIFVTIIVLVLMIVFGISKRLGNMITSVQDIAEGEGDLTKRILIKSKDELGELARWFNIFLDKLQDIIRKIANESSGVDRASKGLAGISRHMAEGAQSTSDQADKVASATEEMSTSLNGVAAAMEQSSNNANIVASAAEEMNSTINEIAANAEKTRTMSESAAEKTIEAGNMMESLNEAAKSISKVTETISDISDQTNLLALNATIEAARAGEAGKGFAIVANEIKELANQTAGATQSIKGQIEDVQNVSRSSIASIREVIDVINDAKDMVSSIATAVTEQSSATQEISINIEQLSYGIQEVNENVNQSSAVANQISSDIAQVNEASTEMLKNSATVKESAGELNEMAEKLKQIVDTFIIDTN